MGAFTLRLHEVLELTDDIGLSDYPIFDESYRDSLNTKIRRHYLNQEIGMETISMFRLAMSRRMWEQMPRFNQLYETEAHRLNLTPADFLKTLGIMTTSDTTDHASNTSSNSDTANVTGSDTSNQSSDVQALSRNIGSDFPQTMLAGDEDYATSGTDAKATTTTSGTGATNSTSNTETTGTASGESNGSSHGEQNTEGFSGSRAALLNDLRGTILNIDLQVIESLSDCFMQVWDNGDNYLPRGY